MTIVERLERALRVQHIIEHDWIPEDCATTTGDWEWMKERYEHYARTMCLSFSISLRRSREELVKRILEDNGSISKGQEGNTCLATTDLTCHCGRCRENRQ